MGTHPIFESDFDCLTDFFISRVFLFSRSMANKMITPQSSLLKYDSPILISKNNDKAEELVKPEKPKFRLDPIDQQKAEDILPKILPPQIFEKDGQKWLQKVSSTPATRLDVQRLAEQLDKKLEQRQARETGICPIRRELYKQAFDEIIRQVTISCAERGLLLLRVRDEINMTLQAYQTIYESSIGFGCRKALFAKKNEVETEELVNNLQAELVSLENEAADLKAKIKAIQRKEGNEREALKRKHTEEVQFLKRNNQQLKQQLEGIVQSKK